MLNLELRLNNEAVAKLEINASLISRLLQAVETSCRIAFKLCKAYL